MAATRYVLMSRYYNSTTNVCATNKSEVEWVSVSGTPKTENFIKEIIEVKESGKLDQEPELQRVIIDGNRRNNPKFDMIFCYSGVDMIRDEMPNLICDTFSRIGGDPWFTNSYHGSLASVLNKARDMVDVIGISNVVIGKELDLSQYIEVV